MSLTPQPVEEGASLDHGAAASLPGGSARGPDGANLICSPQKQNPGHEHT